MKTRGGIHAARVADLLKQIVDCRFESEVLQRGRHKAVTYVSYKLYGVVNDLSCLEDGLQLCGLVLVHEVLIQVKPCRGKQWSRIIVKIGRQALTFFFPQLDGGSA